MFSSHSLHNPINGSARPGLDFYLEVKIYTRPRHTEIATISPVFRVRAGGYYRGISQVAKQARGVFTVSIRNSRPNKLDFRSRESYSRFA